MKARALVLGLLLGVATNTARAAVGDAVAIDPQVLAVQTDTPTPVTLKLDRVPLREACRRLAEQSPVATRILVPDTQANNPISLQLERVPFTQAILEICKQSRLAPVRWHGEFYYDLRPPSETGGRAEWAAGPAQVSGPLVGVLGHLQVHQSKSLESTLPASRSLMADVMVFGEPQVCIYSSRVWLELPHLVDENERVIQATGQNPVELQIAYDSLELHGPIDLPHGFGGHVEQLDASGQLRLVTQFRRVEIDPWQIGAGRSFTTDGITIRLLPMVDRRDWGLEYGFELTVNEPPASPATPSSDGSISWLQLLHRATVCAMIDNRDQVMRNLARSPETQGQTVKLMYRFCPFYPEDGNTRPAKLLLYIPLQVSTVPLQYEFRSIPLRAGQ